MKYLLTFFALFIIVSCSDDDIDYDKVNDKEILKYIADNNLDATKSSTGLYYVIDEQGYGSKPDENSIVTVRYKGYFTNGNIFDQSDNSGLTIGLQDVIIGWAEGIAYFNRGGIGKLLIPSKLAYGENGGNGIPKGTVLIFDIQLLDVDYEKQNEDDILKYIEDHNLTAEKSDSGLYYTIDEKGEGRTPTLSSNITVKYKGYFTNDDVFDSTGDESVTFQLQQLILGWQEGIPYFNEGGKGTLFIPSKLGYGNAGTGNIPPGSVTIFDIDLLKVEN